MRILQTLCVRRKFGVSVLAAIMIVVSSCDSFLDVDIPNAKLPRVTAFADDAAVSSVVAGIYIDLYSLASFAGGGTQGIVSLGGLSADELINNPQTDLTYLEFQYNQLSAKNLNILSTWTSLYKAIYSANSLLEGLSISTSITSETKRQLRGEALFIRAFCNFYLVNLFGDVPLVMSTDYNVNAMLPRTLFSKVYEQIIVDLIEAEELLPEAYVEGERIRPNKFAAQALASRTYLYTNDWARAEDKASSIISTSILYTLPALNLAFLSSSQEAIWQLKPSDNTPSTHEGDTFGSYQAPQYNVLNNHLLNVFETNDQRMSNWVRTLGSGATELHLPYKYKKEDAAFPTTEYSIVLRLAEQYLIRAEARARQNKLSLAIADVDKIRDRAGLLLIKDMNPNVGQEELLTIIMNEKRIEFMVEWGHRWLDIKRWLNAGSVLSVSKDGWSEQDMLYPIPESELRKNPNLNPQNPGY